MLLLAMERGIGVPLAVEPERPEIKHGLGPGFGPAHTRLFHTILDEVPTRAFHDPRAHRPAAREIHIIVHVGRVAAVVSGGAPQSFALRSSARGPARPSPAR